MKTIKVVAAVIRDGNKVFATQRGYGEFKDGWEFPGGKQETGETPEEALKREIKEELETELNVGEMIAQIEYDYPTFHLSMKCFWCTVKAGDLTLKEHEAARWLGLDELYCVNWLPADLSLVKKIEECLKPVSPLHYGRYNEKGAQGKDIYNVKEIAKQHMKNLKERGKLK